MSDSGQIDFQVEAWSGTFSFQEYPYVNTIDQSKRVVGCLMVCQVDGVKHKH
jgi:hypothetical protein